MRRIATVMTLLLLVAACGGGDAPEGDGDRSRGGPGGNRRGGPGGGGRPGGPGAQNANAPAAAVPVEVATVELRDISSYIETNGVLEAESDVDIVARTAGPIVELVAEEGMEVKAGQLLARIDDSELHAQNEIARVELDEARVAHERALKARQDELISVEEYEVARARYESAVAQIESNEVQLGFTRIVAPFDGLVADRYIKFAEHVTNGTPLFRLTDFDPLLCKIQVPERDLPSVRSGQRARVQVEAWPGVPFEARVLRVSPVVDAATGTVRVTLEVRAGGKLRPGMFAKVFVETATHADVRVIPKRALTLDSIGDTVFVAEDGVARRQNIQLGFREGDRVEVLAGLEPGQQVVVVGQDGLSDGTPIQVLDGRGGEVGNPMLNAGGPPGASGGDPAADGSETASPRMAGGPPRGGADGARAKRPDLSKMTPEQLERAKQFMRQRGMTEEQIEERIRQARERSAAQ